MSEDSCSLRGKRVLICLLSFTCNYVVSVLKVSVFESGCVILLWHSLGLPHNYFSQSDQDKRPKTTRGEELQISGISLL